jgi:hypothetical protein
MSLLTSQTDVNSAQSFFTLKSTAPTLGDGSYNALQTIPDTFGNMKFITSDIAFNNVSGVSTFTVKQVNSGPKAGALEIQSEALGFPSITVAGNASGATEFTTAVSVGALTNISRLNIAATANRGVATITPGNYSVFVSNPSVTAFSVIIAQNLTTTNPSSNGGAYVTGITPGVGFAVGGDRQANFMGKPIAWFLANTH